MSHAMSRPQVDSFFHADTFTFSHIVSHEGHAVIIDPVMDFDVASVRTSTRSADALLAHVSDQAMKVDWILETHAHADHLSAGGYLRDALDAPLAIGRGIIEVQRRFKALFGIGDEFIADGRQFDRLFDDGDIFNVGDLQARVLATPGHTDDSLTYVIGDAAFIGDTLFAPEIGSARADFPGGDARRLWKSIQSVLGLPQDTRLFLCHDYPKDREANPLTSIAAQREQNIHLRDGADEETYVGMRRERDAKLPVPRLILPSLQVNIRGGRLPPPDENGIAYLRLPLNQVGH